MEAVLSRTLEDLAVHGIEKLSVDRIARAAAVNKTSVYRRWPTREALVAAALERVLSDVTLKLEDTGTLRGDLLVLARSVAALLGQPVGRELARAAFADSLGPAIAALVARRLESQAKGPAEAMVRRAIERGEWRADVPPQLLITTLVGAILHRALLEHVTPSRSWLTSLIDLVLMGVAPRPARSPRAPRAGQSGR